MSVIPFPPRLAPSNDVLQADVMADIIFSWLLDREAELLELVNAGLPLEDELDVVRALLRLILSPNVRMPLSRLQ